MTYKDFLDRLDAAELTVKEFARLIKRTPNAITNYAGKGEVPAHIAIIATLIAEMNLREIDFRAIISEVDFHGIKPRQDEVKGFRGRRPAGHSADDADDGVLLIIED